MADEDWLRTGRLHRRFAAAHAARTERRQAKLQAHMHTADGRARLSAGGGNAAKQSPGGHNTNQRTSDASCHFEQNTLHTPWTILASLFCGKAHLIIVDGVMLAGQAASGIAGPVLLDQIVTGLTCRDASSTTQQDCGPKSRLYMCALTLLFTNCTCCATHDSCADRCTASTCKCFSKLRRRMLLLLLLLQCPCMCMALQSPSTGFRRLLVKRRQAQTWQNSTASHMVLYQLARSCDSLPAGVFAGTLCCSLAFKCLMPWHRSTLTTNGSALR